MGVMGKELTRGHFFTLELAAGHGPVQREAQKVAVVNTSGAREFNCEIGVFVGSDEDRLPLYEMDLIGCRPLRVFRGAVEHGVLHAVEISGSFDADAS